MTGKYLEWASSADEVPAAETLVQQEEGDTQLWVLPWVVELCPSGRGPSSSSGRQATGKEEGATFRCFYSSLAHDTWRAGWRQRAGVRNSELRDQLGKRSKELKALMNANQAGPAGPESGFSRCQGRRGNDLT